MKAKQLVISLIALICLLAASGCASTRTENGVTIEKNRSANPLNYLPNIPFL